MYNMHNMFQVYNKVMHNFSRLYSIYSYYKILAIFPVLYNTSLYCINQGSPAPGPWTGTGQQPVRNRAAQQEVSGR